MKIERLAVRAVLLGALETMRPLPGGLLMTVGDEFQIDDAFVERLYAAIEQHDEVMTLISDLMT